MKNHWAENIINRGNMNISAITKGWILPTFTYEIRRKHGGGSSFGEGIYQLKHDLDVIKTGQTIEDIDIINIYVDWDKNIHNDKKIYAELLDKKIQVELINYNIKNKIKIDVTPGKSKNPKI